METNKRKKQDALAWVRVERDRIARETEKLSPLEIIAYFKMRAGQNEKVPLSLAQPSEDS
jgi:hypothetical protein